MTVIKKVAVIGAGSMGQGIAQSCAYANYDVLLCDIQPEVVEKGIQSITKNLDQAVAKGKLTAEKKAITLAKIKPNSPADVKADLIIEAVIEKLELKQNIFSEQEKVNDQHAIFATNTSSLSVTKIASLLKRPERFVGLHFFNPAHLMKLVEVIAGEKTDQRLIPELTSFVKSLEKIPVVVKDSPGFIVNRVARHYYLESLRLFEENAADIGTIDALTKSAGFKLGPFELMDLIGNDVNLEVSRQMYEAFGQIKRFKPSAIQEEKVRLGNLGKKTGKGYYEYEKK
ncbi:MAG TPA: 3-hydroxyacyl-CoA dehydrogenase NAD-binding domain-containing protein [Cyclobacteriaceae bacterium]|jgi:3-hydroxybutyryl-CoA dehydrogenase|nr:3-hydroxyacyl-CoA dehydrogenase NAD-binding domain-containing protein [Cyclobacteriaceae bacterium]